VKVAFLLPGIVRHPSGGHKVVYAYANALVESGHAVHIVHSKRFHGVQATSMGAKAWAGAAYHLVARHRRPTWFDLDPRVKVTNSVYPNPRFFDDEDVLVATAAQTAPFVAEVTARRRVAGAYLIQHFEDWSLNSGFVAETWRLPLRRLVIAPWLAEVGDRLGVETHLVPNAIDASEFSPGPPIASRPMTVVAMVSAMKFKRADVVFSAFEKIHEELPEVGFITFGVSPIDARSPDFVRHIHTPTRAQLSALYHEARVYLCASDSEGWHLPPAEAMASGAAVVSTEIGGVTAYARGVAAFSPAGDPAALAREAVRLLKDVDLCSSMALRGQKRVLAYSVADATAQLTHELREAVAARRAASGP
jgi:glycosyltransferase involved in cell wall biosynthesis